MKIKALTLALLVTVCPAFAMEGQYQVNEENPHGVKRGRDKSSSQKKDPQAENTDEKEQKKSRVDGSDDQTNFQGEEEITSNNSLLQGLQPKEIEYLESLDPDQLISYLHTPSNSERLEELMKRCDKIYNLTGHCLQCSPEDILSYGLGKPVSLQFKLYDPMGMRLSTAEELKSFCEILKTQDSINAIKLTGLSGLVLDRLHSDLKSVFQTLETKKVEDLQIEGFEIKKSYDIFLSDFWPHILKMKNLKKLSLGFKASEISKKVFSDLREAGLPLIDFEGEAMNLYDEEAVHHLAFFISGSQSLKRVRMINAEFTPEGMKYLEMGIGSNPNFESFDVTHCHVVNKLEPDFTEFSEIMRKQPKIITGLK